MATAILDDHKPWSESFIRFCILGDFTPKSFLDALKTKVRNWNPELNLDGDVMWDFEVKIQALRQANLTILEARWKVAKRIDSSPANTACQIHRFIRNQASLSAHQPVRVYYSCVGTWIPPSIARPYEHGRTSSTLMRKAASGSRDKTENKRLKNSSKEAVDSGLIQLCYKDISLKFEFHPKTGETFLVMSIGENDKPIPLAQRLTFSRRLSRCPIIMFIALARLDGAFATPSLTSGRRVVRTENGERVLIPLNWKEEWLEQPILSDEL